MAKRRVKNKRSLLRYLVWLVVLVIGGYLGYSVWYTKQINPEQGLVTCVPAKQSLLFGRAFAHEDQTVTTEHVEEHAKEELARPENAGKCFYSAHIHADVELSYCGKLKDLPKDKGVLNGPHTHKESNLIHGPHAALPADPKTKQVIDKTPLTVQGFLDAMEIDLKTACPGEKQSSATISVNDQAKSLDYVWQDGDSIVVTYD